MPDFNHLRAGLPPVTFDPERDSPLAPASGYLQHYGLDALPGLHRAGVLACRDYRLGVQYWLPGSPARSTILVVHGYYDHLGLYGHLVQHCLQRGEAVLGFDLPGHGLSSGPRASIPSFDVYGDVIEAVCQAVSGRLPPLATAIGQSTGCAALLNGLMTGHPLPFTRLVLLAPLLRPHRWATQGRFLYTALHKVITHLPRQFSENSNDANFVRFCKESDPLQTRQLSVQWVSAMKAWLDSFDQRPTVDLPTLIVQGQQDTTVDWRYNIPALLGKLPQAELEYLPTARHHLVNESESIRNTLWPLIDRFLEHHH